MQALVIYDSKYGNTERIARAVAERIGTLRPVPLHEVTARELASCELLVVGGPTHSHGMSAPMREFVETVAAEVVRDVPVAVFDTRYHMIRPITGSAAYGIARHLRQLGARLVVPPESFFVTHAHAPEETSLEAGEIERACAWATLVLHETEKIRERVLVQ